MTGLYPAHDSDISDRVPTENLTLCERPESANISGTSHLLQVPDRLG